MDEENYEQYEPEVENHKKLKAESTSGSFANKSVIKSFSSKSIGQSNRSFDEKCKDHTENKKLGLCYRKRKIAVIRRRKLIRKPVFQIDLSRSFFHKDNGNRSDKEADHVEISRVKDEKKNCDCDQSNCPPGSKSKIKDFPIASKNKEVHYVSQVLRNPFADSLTSNDDFRSQNSERFDTENLEMACHSKAYSSLPAFNTNFSRDFINEKRKEVKVWKSKVLETVANKSWKIKSDPITLRKIKIKYLAKVIENILRKKLTRKRNILMNEIFLNFQKECELNEALMGRKNVLVRRQENFKRYPLTVQKKESITETVQSTSEKINSVQDFSNLKQKHSNSNKFVFEEEAIMEKFKRESSDSQVIRSWVNTAFSDESNVNHLDATSSKASETKIFEDFLEPLDLTMEESLPEFKNRVSRESIKKVDFAPPSNSQNPLENAPCLHDSEESFSLYYSKAADLASPLLDMKRFIYPDHIHYSYKHVKKKGFDVDINGGLPLLVRESLTMNNPINLENVSTLQNPQSGIIRRPMDLSFASTSAEWQNSDHDRSSFQELEIAKDEGMEKAVNKNKSQYFESTAEMKLKSKKWRKNNFREDFPFERKSNCRNSYSFKPFEHDYYLIEKLLKMCKKINNEKPVSSFDELDNERPPVQISSTQLHSNKGRINSTYNPAIFLNENKTRSERRKAETQEERTKDMFARLEREILLQSKNLHKDFGPSQNS